jgi:hypothetical protein
MSQQQQQSVGLGNPSQISSPLVRIGHYRLGKTLGIGSFGKVKREYSFSFFFFFSNTLYIGFKDLLSPFTSLTSLFTSYLF